MNREDEIRDRLQRELQPEHLEVHDESHNHAVKPGAQSHFRVVVVAGAFEGKGAVARHKMVYAAVGDSLGHALAVTARTPSEWSRRPEAPASPPCAGVRGKA